MAPERWFDNAEYIAEVEERIKPLRGTRFHQPMRFGMADTTRFDYFIDRLRPYTSFEGKRILDSGCGTGGLCLRLLPEKPAHITGIELNPIDSRMAASRTHQLPNVKIINDDATMALLPAASFDIIFSLHVIEHVVDAERYVREMAMLLKPGGLLFLACPNRILPFESHTQLPLINYVPRHLAKHLALALARLPGISPELRRRLETSTLYEHDFTHFDIKRLIRKAGLTILEQNHPRFFDGELIAYNAYALRRMFGALDLRWQWYLSALFSQNINAICRKPA